MTWITIVWFCISARRSVKVLPVAKSGKRSENCGCGSVGRASPCQGEGRGFESRHPLGRLAQRERASLTRKRSLVRSQYRPRSTFTGLAGICPAAQAVHADVAQLVEHHLAKVRVAGSSPVIRSQSGIHTIPLGVVGWPRGEAAACKAVYTGSNPVPTSGDWRRGSALPSHGRGHWFDPSIAHQQVGSVDPVFLFIELSSNVCGSFFRPYRVDDVCVAWRWEDGRSALGVRFTLPFAERLVSLSDVCGYCSLFGRHARIANCISL